MFSSGTFVNIATRHMNEWILFPVCLNHAIHSFQFSEDTIFEFSVAVTRREIIEEKLVEIRSASERILYHRKDGKPNFDSTLKDDQFLQYAFQGTRNNQLFLTNSVTQQGKP